jgi:hypothetical protein
MVRKSKKMMNKKLIASEASKAKILSTSKDWKEQLETEGYVLVKLYKKSAPAYSTWIPQLYKQVEKRGVIIFQKENEKGKFSHSCFFP